MDLVRFVVLDLRGFEYFVGDAHNGSYFGPHDSLEISDSMFHFAVESPTIPRIRDILESQHIQYNEVRQEGW